MKAAFGDNLPNGRTLKDWMSQDKNLTLDAEFHLFGARAKQTDLDNLLKELFNQMLLGLFPALPHQKRSRKDSCFFEVHIRKVEVRDKTKEKSIIIIKPYIQE